MTKEIFIPRCSLSKRNLTVHVSNIDFSILHCTTVIPLTWVSDWVSHTSFVMLTSECDLWLWYRSSTSVFSMRSVLKLRKFHSDRRKGLIFSTTKGNYRRKRQQKCEWISDVTVLRWCLGLARMFVPLFLFRSILCTFVTWRDPERLKYVAHQEDCNHTVNKVVRLRKSNGALCVSAKTFCESKRCNMTLKYDTFV